MDLSTVRTEIQSTRVWYLRDSEDAWSPSVSLSHDGYADISFLLASDPQELRDMAELISFVADVMEDEMPCLKS